MSNKVVLAILDGWGLAPNLNSNAITHAKTPCLDNLFANYPHSTLTACGEDVGLPIGQMGNSEVGHLNIGAGRIVWQELANINKAVRENTIDNEPILIKAFKIAKERNCNLHFIGLVSDGGVHSHIDHLKKLCSMANNHKLSNVFIHAFTDGRDTDPKSGIKHLTELENHLVKTTGKIASICGRYFAMDRDKRWERVKIAYDALVNSKGHYCSNWKTAINNSYIENVTDEFIKPIIVTDENGIALASIKKDDVVICFNFRTDRCREITTVLTQKDFPEFQMQTIPLHFFTMTRYDESYKNIEVVFEKNNLTKTLGELIELNNKKQIRIAETEKYPHVTFFFSGGREEAFHGEKRILIPSAKVATYDLKPEMSAFELKDALVPELLKGEADFVCLNFANADMVGHTGVFSAVVKAVETVDACLQEVIDAGIKSGYNFIVIADHGNADMMINQDGSPNTAHSLNPVPCILVTNDTKLKIKSGRLADIAPTILTLMGIPIPKEMTGSILIS